MAALSAVYAGFRFGIRQSSLFTDAMKAQATTIQTAFLALFSFLMAFSFGSALHHFDSRNEAMKEEANAIGTTYLRAHALPDSVRVETLMTLQKYLDVRVQEEAISLNKTEQRDSLLQDASHLRTRLWELAMKSVKDDDRITTTGLYIQTLNNLIDSYGTRDEALNRSIPDALIFSLMIALIFWAGSIGYTSAVFNFRPTGIAIGFIISIQTCPRQISGKG